MLVVVKLLLSTCGSLGWNIDAVLTKVFEHLRLYLWRLWYSHVRQTLARIFLKILIIFSDEVTVMWLCMFPCLTESIFDQACTCQWQTLMSGNVVCIFSIRWNPHRIICDMLMISCGKYKVSYNPQVAQNIIIRAKKILLHTSKLMGKRVSVKHCFSSNRKTCITTSIRTSTQTPSENPVLLSAPIKAANPTVWGCGFHYVYIN